MPNESSEALLANSSGDLHALTIVTKPPFHIRLVEAFDEIKLTVELQVRHDLVSCSFYLLESAFLLEISLTNKSAARAQQPVSRASWSPVGLIGQSGMQSHMIS
jgi:hypothetical protein